jgi:5-methylcytosine-specific restriction endonuclease McrA
MNCENCGGLISKRKGTRFCSTLCRRRTWIKNNPDKVQAHQARDTGSKARSLRRYYEVLKHDPKEAERQRQKAKLRKQRLRSLPKNFNSADWKAALEYFEYKCAYCGDPLSKPEQEHFVPVKQGGGFTRDNIVPACSNCNSDKRGKNPVDWLASKIYGLVAYARVMHYFASQRPPQGLAQE